MVTVPVKTSIGCMEFGRQCSTDQVGGRQQISQIPYDSLCFIHDSLHSLIAGGGVCKYLHGKWCV